MASIRRMSTKGRVVIPIGLRRKLGWEESQRVLIRDVGGKLTIEPAEGAAAWAIPAALQLGAQFRRPAAAPHGSQ